MIHIQHIGEVKDRGAMSELKAAAWLMEQGYEVYRNVSAHGQHDLVAYNKETGEFKGYDVKTATYNVKEESGEVNVSCAGSPYDVTYLLVLPDGQIMPSEAPSIKGLSEANIKRT
jgi:hypothetical protein